MALSHAPAAVSFMLPAPVSLSHRSGFRCNASAAPRRTISVLFSRVRVKSLGLIFLATFAVFSFLFNVRYYFLMVPSAQTPPLSILHTLARKRTLQNLTHLIIVPGHAIWKGTKAEQLMDEEEWILESYQRGRGSVSSFYNQIIRGAELALNDDLSLLIFSGGQTRQLSTATEGESYLRLALASDAIHGSSAAPFSRATSENYALDSYENLLFSIARFHQYTGRYPEQITVVGYEMKRRRFDELHRKALRWPEEKFQYIGVDLEGGDYEVSAQEGERQNGYLPYTRDLYGCHTFLLSKRRERNPFMRFHSYYTSTPELKELLDWCPDISDGGNSALFEGPLPWD